MLLFSTILDFNETLTKEAFIQLVIDWNQGSPHKDNVIQNLVWKDERNIRFGETNLWMAIEEYRNEDIIAVRFEKRELSGIIWNTDYVANFQTMKMAIRLDRSYAEDAVAADTYFSTPFIITLLIEKGYVKNDGVLPVLSTPIIVDHNNLEILADVINGVTRYKLPIVYVSKTEYNENPVDVNELAKRLKGVAHVLVQKSSGLNRRIMPLCDKKNEFNGAIGIYYPNPQIGHSKLLYRRSFGSDGILLDIVIRTVIQFSNTQMIEPLYTWHGVNNALLRDRLNSQQEERLAAEIAKRKAEEEAEQLITTLDEEERKLRTETLKQVDEANKIIESADEDFKRLRNQIEELTDLNDSLLAENHGLKAKLDFVEFVPILCMGNEIEFYPGEIKDLLLTILEETMVTTPAKTRRSDIIKDIITNNRYEEIGKGRAREVKRLLTNYSGMTPKLRQSLERLGFQVEDESKHIKVKYFGNARYQVIFAKTPSDVRSGRNNAQELIKVSY